MPVEYVGAVATPGRPGRSGKTTTINCLTGMTQPTSGNALVAGHSILTDMNDVRRRVGLCPQHDVRPVAGRGRPGAGRGAFPWLQWRCHHPHHPHHTPTDASAGPLGGPDCAPDARALRGRQRRPVAAHCRRGAQLGAGRRTRGQGGRRNRDALWRPKTTRLGRRGLHRRLASRLLGRADGGARPALAPRDLGARQCAPRRPHHPHHDALPRRGACVCVCACLCED